MLLISSRVLMGVIWPAQAGCCEMEESDLARVFLALSGAAGEFPRR